MPNEIDKIRKYIERGIEIGSETIGRSYADTEGAFRDLVTLLAKVDELEALVSVHIEKPVPDDDPMQAIGERLSELLGEDDFNWIEPKLNGIRYHTKELESHVETLVARLGSRVPAQEPKP